MSTRRRAASYVGGLGLSAALLVSCSEGPADDVSVDAGPSTASVPPSSSAPPDQADQADQAAGSGEPRLVDTIATGLEAPWGLAFLPDGDAILTERDTTRVLRVSAEDRSISQVGTLEVARPQGEAGALGVAVSPDFATDRTLFFYVTTASDNRVVSATLDGDRLSATTPVFTGIPNGAIHDGGRLQFGPDGYLYVSTGEGGQPERAPDRDSMGGKILRLTTGGDPAPGNPFDSPVWSYGHRNVQGLAFVGDQLWASEFGQNTFDELNRIEPGGDYGWPEVEGEGGTDAGYVDPQRVWDTGEASPSGLAYLDGALWMASLRGNRLWRVAVDGDRAGATDDFLVGDYGRLRTVVVAPDDTLWVTTSNRDGRGDPGPQDDRILVVDPG